MTPSGRARNAPRISSPALASAVIAGLLGVHSSAQAQTTPPSSNDRVLGLDISAWQGNWSTTQWATLKRPTNQQVNGVFGDGRDFVIIRSSRGGTTGYYNQSNAGNNNPPGQNTLSQRYDDPYFAQNITRATAAGMLAGSYHFGRMDIIESTLNSNGIRNTGADEADHFIQMAGQWMRPGYLVPMFDWEAGLGIRTSDELAQFAIDFSNRIHQVKGIRPSVYIGNNYASPMNNTAKGAEVAALYPVLINARWPNQANPNSIAIQDTDPGDYTPSIYGPWDNGGQQDPWSFWQYCSTGQLNAYSGNLDLDVAHGNIEFVKDTLVPALWTKTTSGTWGDVTNWNSGETPAAPVHGPGQVARVGTLVLPTPRSPGRPDAATGVSGQDDTVNLIRANENITVTLDGSTPAVSIRRLNLNERLNVTGSTLDVRLTGIVGTGGTLGIFGGTTTIDQTTFNSGSALEFGGAGTLTVGSLILNSNVTYVGSAGMGVLNGKAGAPAINLAGGTRTFTIGEGSAATDLRVALPISNGNIIKEGLGTLELTGNNSGFTGTVLVNNGVLLLSANNQLGTTGVTTGQTASAGGTVQLAGANLSYNLPLTIGGAGRGLTSSTQGALENVSGNNTWSGPIFLAGNQGNINQTNLNQIYAAAGTTLTLSGVIQNAAGLASATWAKTGDGDVVLGGSSPNLNNNLTRIFGGRLIIEKNGALGTAGTNSATANTFQVAGTIAFRAPAGSPSLNYSTFEWIHTDGTGFGGLGQIDNLGGDNVANVNLGLGGPIPVGGSVRESYLGVSAGSLEIQGGLYAKSLVSDEQRNIFKSGVGTLILSGNSAGLSDNTQDRALVNSSFTVNAGAVLLKGTAGGTANVPGVTAWNVSGVTSKLSLDKTGATGNAAINLLGGTLHTSAVAGVSVAGSVALPTTGAGGTVDVGAGASMTLAGSLDNNAGKSLTKVGAGTLVLSGAQLHGAGASFNANAGTTNFNTDPGTLANAKLALNVGGGGALVNLNSAQHIASLAIANGGKATLATGAASTLRTASLSIATGGVLETNDNDIVVDYAVGQPSPYETLSAYAVNAFLNRAGGAIRTGPVLQPDRILAVLDNGAIGLPDWRGEAIDSTTVIGKYLLFGDANLDGDVSELDYAWGNAIPEGGGAGGAAGWTTGDFTYDGQVTYMDLAALDANLGKGSSDPYTLMFQQRMIDEHTAVFGQPYVDALAHAQAGDFAYLFGASVPEPGALFAGVFAAAGVGFRRRRG